MVGCGWGVGVGVGVGRGCESLYYFSVPLLAVLRFLLDELEEGMGRRKRRGGVRVSVCVCVCV